MPAKHEEQPWQPNAVRFTGANTAGTLAIASDIVVLPAEKAAISTTSRLGHLALSVRLP